MQSRLGRTNQVLAVTNLESPNLRFHHGWHHLRFHAGTSVLRARLEWMDLQAQWARPELMELQARPALQALRARLDWTELQGSPALQVLRARLELMELQALVLLWMRWRYESHFLRDLSWHHCLQTSTRSPFWVRVLGRSRVPPRLAQRQVRIPRMAHFRCPDVRGFFFSHVS